MQIISVRCYVYSIAGADGKVRDFGYGAEFLSVDAKGKERMIALNG